MCIMHYTLRTGHAGVYDTSLRYDSCIQAHCGWSISKRGYPPMRARRHARGTSKVMMSTTMANFQACCHSASASALVDHQLPQKSCTVAQHSVSNRGHPKTQICGVSSGISAWFLRASIRLAADPACLANGLLPRLPRATATMCSITQPPR